MADIYSHAKRSRIMAAIRGTDTTPELAVRSMLTAFGRRFICNPSDVVGRPDIAFTRGRKAIFVHGCFWHQHPRCSRATIPATNRAWWQEKFAANRVRDRRIARALRRSGWSVLIVWECQARRPDWLGRRLRQFVCG